VRQGFRAAHAGRQFMDVLDLGCSVGVSSRFLAAEYPQAQVVGLDLSPYFLAVAEYRERCVLCLSVLAAFLSICLSACPLLAARRVWHTFAADLSIRPSFAASMAGMRAGDAFGGPSVHMPIIRCRHGRNEGRRCT
jgi:SAM-dependent methyltransferase